MRAISTVDVALWDLLGQYTGQPIYNLLGGRSRDRIPIYNTCVSHAMTPLLDCLAWMEGRAGELSKELLATGVRAMKIWSWDQFGDQTHHAEFLQMTPVRHGLASCYQNPSSAFSQPVKTPCERPVQGESVAYAESRPRACLCKKTACELTGVVLRFRLEQINCQLFSTVNQVALISYLPGESVIHPKRFI